MTPNPKAAAGAKKTPMNLLPPVALDQIARAMECGANRYKAWNWRTAPIQISTYVAAVMRHTAAWAGGEDTDPDSGLSHLAHIGANVNILLDAAHCGTLVDDRPKMPDQTGRFRGFMVNPDYEDAEDPDWRDTPFGKVWNGPPVPLQFEDFAVPTGMNGIQPAQEYRMLEEGEIIQAGDEVTAFTGPSRWIPAYGEFLERPVYSHNVGCIRRPIQSGADL